MKQQELSLTNNDVLLAEQGLSTLRSMELPSVTAYRIASNLRVIKLAADTYREVRDGAIEGKVVLDERGGYVPDMSGELTFLTAEDRAYVKEELKALGNAENTLNLWVGFTVEDLFGSNKEGKIRPVIFETLYWMFDEA